MSVSVADCDAIIAACDAAGVKLTVNFVTRFRHAPKAMKRLVDEGAIGDVRIIEMRGTWTGFLLEDIVDEATGRVIIPKKEWAWDPAEGSQFLDWGVHETDALRWLTGSEVARVYAEYHTFGTPPPVDLTAQVQVTMQNGVMAQMLMTYETPEPGLVPNDWTRIVGSKGIIEADHYGKVRLGDADGWRVADEQVAFDFLGDYLDPNRLEGFAAQVQDFAEAIQDGRDPVVTGAGRPGRGRDRGGGRPFRGDAPGGHAAAQRLAEITRAAARRPVELGPTASCDEAAEGDLVDLDPEPGPSGIVIQPSSSVSGSARIVGSDRVLADVMLEDRLGPFRRVGRDRQDGQDVEGRRQRDRPAAGVRNGEPAGVAGRRRDVEDAADAAADRDVGLDEVERPGPQVRLACRRPIRGSRHRPAGSTARPPTAHTPGSHWSAAAPRASGSRAPRAPRPAGGCRPGRRRRCRRPSRSSAARPPRARSIASISSSTGSCPIRSLIARKPSSHDRRAPRPTRRPPATGRRDSRGSRRRREPSPGAAAVQVRDGDAATPGAQVVERHRDRAERPTVRARPRRSARPRRRPASNPTISSVIARAASTTPGTRYVSPQPTSPSRSSSRTTTESRVTLDPVPKMRVRDRWWVRTRTSVRSINWPSSSWRRSRARVMWARAAFAAVCGPPGAQRRRPARGARRTAR